MPFHFFWIFAWLRFILDERSRSPPFLFSQRFVRSDQVWSNFVLYDQVWSRRGSELFTFSRAFCYCWVNSSARLKQNIWNLLKTPNYIGLLCKTNLFQKDHLWSLGWAKEVHKSSSPCGAPWVPAEMKPIYERNIYVIQHLHLEGKK